MKIALTVLGGLVLLAGLGIFWGYNSLHHQPEHFEELPAFKFTQIKQEGRALRDKIKEDLQQDGQAALSGDELATLVLSQIEKRGKVNLRPVVKKLSSKIVEGELQIEALLNVKNFSNKNIPEKARPYIEPLLEFVPQDLLENLYVSFQGVPVQQGSVIKFDENARIKIGGFNYDLSSIKGSHKIRIGASVLSRLGVSGFEMDQDKMIVRN